MSETTVKREHVLTVTKHADWHPDDPYWVWDVACATPDLCGGWWECLNPHEVDGVSAADGPYDGDETLPWCDEDEFEFHGVLHTWRYGHGWTVPYDGCVVQTADLGDDVCEIAREHGPGSYVVDDDWDDTDCRLGFVRPAEPAPATDTPTAPPNEHAAAEGASE